MMHTLNLFAHVLDRVRRYQQANQLVRAHAILRRLARFRNLPAEIAEQVEVRLAEGLLRRRRFRAARRHLRAALRHRVCARYHYLMALACHHDPHGDLDRAARHYRRALRLSPRWVRCLTEAGLLDIARGCSERGLGLLRRAADLAPDDVLTIGKLARGLCRSGRPEEASTVIRLARFRAPRCPRLQQLAADLQVSLLRRRQETGRLGTRDDRAPVLLPFVRLLSFPHAAAPLRHDGAAAALPGPHLIRLRVRHGQRTAR